MGGIRLADLRTALDLVAELGEADGVEAFGVGGVAGLQRLIPADAIAFSQIATSAGRAVAVVDPPEVMFDGSEEVLARYGPQNPLIAHAINEPHTRALKISDFVSRREFHRTDIYEFLFRPNGLEYQMACGLPGPPALIVGISINRSGRDFSERERALLDLLRPHLVQKLERAAARELARTTISALERGIGGVGRAAIVLGGDGEIHSASPQAYRWLQEYFPGPVCDGRLPAPLATWHENRRAMDREGGSQSNHQPLEVCRGSRSLTVQPAFGPGPDEDVLVLEERHAAPSDRLRELGLTPRQAEILRLIAAGHSDGQIARKLSLSEHTVGKHLEHIFTRLQVTTRTAAAAMAWRATP